MDMGTLGQVVEICSGKVDRFGAFDIQDQLA